MNESADDLDLYVAEIIADHGGLASCEHLYVLEGSEGGIVISTTDQADAWAWDISRPLAEQLAETADDHASVPAPVSEVGEVGPSEPAPTCTATGGVLYGDDVRCELPAWHDGGHLSHQGGELRW